MTSKSKKSKEVIENILASMNGTFTTEKILKEFRKPKDKADNKLCMAILKNLVKNNPKAKKPFEEIINNFDKHEPYDCLEKFLIGFYKEELASKNQGSSVQSNTTTNNSKLSESSAEPRKINNSKQNKSPAESLSSKEVKSDIISPGFSSTKINDDLVTVPVLNVADIKNRVVKAAIDGVSKYAQNSIVDPPHSPKSIFYDANVKKNSWFHDDSDLAVVQNSRTSSVLATPITDQERILLKEILYCLIGVPGTFIKTETIHQPGDPLPTMVFNISSEVNVSLRDMANGILPLANYYSQVQRFILIVTSANSGQILQSLAATLRSLTVDYYNTLVKLESDMTNMNLNRLQHCLRPSMKTMELLAEVVNEIARSDNIGARVLTILSEKVTLLTGDAIGQQLLVDLVEAAAVPYFETLERWILKGKLIWDLIGPCILRVPALILGGSKFTKVLFIESTALSCGSR